MPEMNPPRLSVTEIRSSADYQHYRATMEDEDKRRRSVELSLIDFGAERFKVDGFCAICNRATRFDVSPAYAYEKTPHGNPISNWREHLVWEWGFRSRFRAAIHVVTQKLAPPPEARIYVTERVTGLYEWLRARYPNLVGSEYLGDKVSLGMEHDGVRNEDLAALTF